jgi:predicted RNA polymerase sigma factor
MEGFYGVGTNPTSRGRSSGRSYHVVNYQPYWAARGHLLQLLDWNGEAQEAYTRTASLTDDPALREYLFRRSCENIENI